MRRRKFGTNKPVPRRPSWTPNKTRVSGQVTERVRTLAFPIKCPFRGGSAPSFGRKELGYSVPRLTFGHRRAGTRCPGGKGYRRLRIRKLQLQSQQHSHVTRCPRVRRKQTGYIFWKVPWSATTVERNINSPASILISIGRQSTARWIPSLVDGSNPVRRINLVPPSHQKRLPNTRAPPFDWPHATLAGTRPGYPRLRPTHPQLGSSTKARLDACKPAPIPVRF